MYNEIKHSKLFGRLTGYKVSTAAPGAISLDLGVKDGTVARVAAGKGTVSFAEPFKRAPVVVGAPVGTVTAGTYFRAAAGVVGSFTGELWTAAGAAEEGSWNALVAGWETDDDDTYGADASSIRNTNGYEPVLIGLTINASGEVVVGSKRATCSASTGTFTITLRDQFANATPIVLASIIEADSSMNARVVSRSASGAVIITETAAGVEAAASFQVLMLGWRAPDISYGRRQVVLTPRLKPRIEFFKLLNTAGVPSVAEGAATVSATEVGDWTVEFATSIKPVDIAPIVIVSGATTRAQLGATPTEAGFQVLQYDNAGVAADGTVYAAALMFDYADQF